VAHFKCELSNRSFTVRDPISQAESQSWISLVLAFAPSPAS